MDPFDFLCALVRQGFKQTTAYHTPKIGITFRNLKSRSPSRATSKNCVTDARAVMNVQLKITLRQPVRLVLWQHLIVRQVVRCAPGFLRTNEREVSSRDCCEW